MILAYLLLLVIAICFKMLHWPGGSVFLLISPLFPFVDIFIQMTRDKKDKVFRILSSLAIFGFSIFLMFKILYWPGARLMIVFAFMTMTPFMILLLMKKFAGVKSFRYYYLAVLAVFSLYFFSLKRSEQMEFLLLENPMDKNEHLPPSYLQAIAFTHYKEGHLEKAAKLIKIAMAETEYRLKNSSGQEAEWLKLDLEILKKELSLIGEVSWIRPEILHY